MTRTNDTAHRRHAADDGSVEPDPGTALPAPITGSRVPGTVGSIVVAALVTAVYVLYSALEWRRFTVKSWDLGIFTQLAQDYSRLQAPLVSIKGDGFNLMGDHFHPILVLLGPVYAVWPHAFALLVVQAVLIGISVVGVGRMAGRVVGRWGAIVVAAAYGLSWGIQGAVAFQFHEIAFALPLLAFALDAVIARRALAAAAWAVPLVFVKEDLGLTVAVLGAIIALTMDRRIGVALAGWGVAWFVLATTVILPAFNREARWDYASKLDAGGALADPLGTVAGLFVAPKLETVAFLILAGALIALRSPLLLLVVPTLAWRFLSPTEAYWAPGYHYDAVLMPIVFAAAIDGIVRARRGRQHWLAMASRATVPVLAVAAIALFFRSPMVDLTKPAIWQPAPRAAQAQAALDQVPAGASVLSDIGLMSYLVDDHEVFWLGNPGNPAPQYVVIDSLGGGLGQGALNADQYGEATQAGTTYEIVYADAGYQVARRTQ
ncbi:DUF2079 domain-containing protein [Clavibacter michiganensis subsp. michiganensis]|uniref:DUF2079 domain-containing protein n=1 Tax=Clavibacter michiganensis TaxID=28447 RepID=UPI001FF17579|nr:DUF2079 domain-containing protein [Clavibacter michiganensis]UOW03592.1 DUF2079 domain-containing protein [Clavibacter michiganensis subsp. michiganensis]